MDLENYNDGSGDWRFRYKTNSPGANGSYYSDVLAEIREPAGLVGTWTITFVNNTNVTMTTPSGLTTNFIFSADKVSWFADNAGVALPMYHYVGARANGTANYGLNAIVSRVQIQGSPATLDDYFLADESLDTAQWELASQTAASIQLLPTSANPVYWVSWTLPDNGFALQSSPTLTGGWNDSAAPRLTLVPGRKVLINASDLPGSTQGYFRLVKRVASKLQVLLPGETSAPGTPTGKTGTPDATLTISGNPQAIVTVNLCDETWHILTSATDRVHLTCTDPGAWVSDDAALIGGTGTFYINFYSPGTYTVTGSDVSNPAISPNTSSSVTVGP
jgi:hypothetical protein